MRLNILRRGGGGKGGVLIYSLLLGTSLGTKILDTHAQLDKRVPQPQGPPPPVTVWVTVNVQGGWMVTEFSTKTITETPTGLPGLTSIATVTNTITTATTVTNTVTVQSTTTQTGTTQPSATSTAVITDKPTVTTITSSAAAPMTTSLASTWAQGAPVVRRQAPVTVTSTATVWNLASGTTTSVITVTAQPASSVNNFLAQTSMALLTTTLTTTQISTFTTEQTVTGSVSHSSPTGLVVDGADPLGSKQNIPAVKTPNVEVIVGASFGALVGFIGIFVLAYLWAKKRRDANLRKESVGFSTEGLSRSTPAAGAGVMGMLGSLRRGSSAARYNNLPTTESIPNASPLPQSPPPQLPTLRVNPPSGEFNCDYTFGSPVSSIGEAQLHALTSGGSINRTNTPPTEPPAASDAQYYTLSRQSEEPPWRTRAAVAETVAAETVVSSVSAESERTGSLRRKPLPGDDLVSP